ncbi:hypothetical protein OG225_09650 [Nocardia sp. NBC_01377]|uniref:hypothetical protein n=1 Tax=Nocardia sp. NBC_01377 TaxID=2903595 RepID=UPI00324DF73B
MELFRTMLVQFPRRPRNPARDVATPRRVRSLLNRGLRDIHGGSDELDLLRDQLNRTNEISRPVDILGDPLSGFIARRTLPLFRDRRQNLVLERRKARIELVPDVFPAIEERRELLGSHFLDAIVQISQTVRITVGALGNLGPLILDSVGGLHDFSNPVARLSRFHTLVSENIGRTRLSLFE